MKLFELVEFLKKQAIVLDVVEGKLSISGDETKLTAELIEDIKRYKGDLSAYIQYKNSPEIPVGEAIEGKHYALSFAQRRLYFLYQYESSTTQFNLPVCLTLSDNFDHLAFKQALLTLVERHNILRTTFSVVDGVPVQTFHQNQMMDYEFHDLSEQSQQFVDETRSSIAENVCLSPFDLNNELPLKVRLVKLPDQNYSLFMVFHHIATDQWSIKNCLDELKLLYGNYSSAQQKPLLPLSVSYFDFAKWQNEHHDNGCYEVVKSYWKEYFAGVSGFLQLPLDFERPATQKFTNGFALIDLPETLSAKVAQFTDRTQVSGYSFFLSVFNILLSKLCNDNDIVVGVDVFGRDHHDLNDVQGFFVNQLALRSQLDQQQSFVEYMTDVHADTLRCFSFQDMPFDLLIEGLELERTTAFAPLFQVKYLYDVSEQSLDLFDGVDVTFEKMFESQSQYDITLKVQNKEIYVNYNNSLFRQSTIESWLAQMIAIAEEVLAEPTVKLADTLQRKLNNDVAPLIEGKRVTPPASSIMAQIAAVADNCPEQLAVSCDNASLDYAQLMQRVNCIAANLLEMGVEKGMTIGVHLDRSTDYIVAILAVMKVGGVFMPLDPDNPTEQLDYMLDNSGATIILSNEHFSSYLTDFYGIILELESLSYFDGAIDEVAFPEVSADDAAYLLYTSGSTGRPKGILIRQGSLNNMCHWYKDFAQLQPASACLLMIAIGFDASLKEIFTPLLCGAQVVVAKSALFDPDYLLNLIDRHQVKHVNTVPSAAYALFKQDEANDYQKLSSVRFFAVGGEPTNLALFKPWFNSDNCHAVVANLYGPTECTDISVAYKNDKQGFLAMEYVPIGQPIYNVEARIVDSNLKLCPVGVPGELIISGAGVGIGYQQNEAETSKRFIDSEFSSEKVFRTGDFCKYNSDGDIVYIGRQDGQIKIRGKRVEVSQITFHISQLLPDNRSVVQLYRSDAIETLVAFVEGDKAEIKVDEVRSDLTKQLPLFMVPSAIVVVDKFPFSVNGKTDSKALEKIYQQCKHEVADLASHDFNEVEQMIADVWCNVLAIEQFNPQDSFFSIGGDSILSIQVVSELNKRGYQCTVYDIFKYPTFDLFAKFLQDAKSGAHGESGENTDSHPQFIEPFALLNEQDRGLISEQYEDAYPLTNLQQGMLFERDLNQSTSMYHDFSAWQLNFKHDFDIEHFIAALKHVMSVHPLLRTVFDMQRYSQPLQLVRKSAPSNITQYDISELNESQQHDFIAQKLKEIKALELDVLNDSLINFTLITVAKNRLVFINDCHHAIIDGWSNALLNRQVYDSYKRIRDNEALEQAEALTANFAAYVAREYEQVNAVKSQQYWLDYLSGNYHSEVVAQQPLSSADFSSEIFNPSSDLLASLESLCQKYDVPAKQVFFAAHFYVLSFITGNSQLMTGIVENGRFESTDGDKVIGLFLNTLPVKADLQQSTWLELIAALNDSLIEHKAVREFPYSQMINLKPGLRLDSLFNYINFHVLDVIQHEDEVELSLFDDFFEEISFKFATSISGNFADGFAILFKLGWAVPQHYMQVVKSLYFTALEQMISNIEQPINHQNHRFVAELPPVNSELANGELVNREMSIAATPQAIKLNGQFEPQTFAAALNFMIASFVGVNQNTEVNRCDIDVTAPQQQQLNAVIAAVADKGLSDDNTTAAAVSWTQTAEGCLLAVNFTIANQSLHRAFYNKLIDIYHVMLGESCGKPCGDDLYHLLIDNDNQTSANWLTSGEVKRQFERLQYWQTQLAQLPIESPLPLEQSQQSLQQSSTNAAATVTSQLDKQQSQQLVAVAAEQQLTPFMLLHAALTQVLSRYSNRSDIVIGTVNGTNPLVLRVDSDIAALDDYLAHIRAVNLAAQANQDVELAQLVELLQPVQHAQDRSLFHVGLTANAELASEPVLEQAFASVALSINANIGDDGIDFSWRYNSDLLTAACVERLTEHFNNLLTQLIAQLQQPQTKAQLADLAMLSEAETQQLIHGLNQPRVASRAGQSENRLIHQLFEQQAALTPDAVAVVFKDEHWSYQQLNVASNQLAHYLMAQGVVAETIVGICVEPSIEMLVAIMAVLKAGGAYVPLDANYPSARLAYIIEDSQLTYLLSQAELLQQLALDNAILDKLKVIDVDPSKLTPTISSFSCDNPVLPAGVTAATLAYIIYTSGTSGTPKGVMVEHNSVVAFKAGFEQQLSQLDVGFNSPWLWASSFAFDASLKGVVMLLNGGTVVVAESMVTKDPAAIAALIEQHKMPVYNSTPAMVNEVISHLSQSSHQPQLIVSGEQVSLNEYLQLQAYAKRFDRQVINAYGPTETTVNSTFGVINQQLSIGKPIENTVAYVLDSNHNLVPFGAIGELHIGGAGLTRGYLNQAQLTAEKFIANPFSDIADDRLYKTGDLVRYLADGQLAFVGRIDDQVKIRGYRIELGEIESCLSQCEQVTEALVLVREDQSGDKSLVAYVCCPLATADHKLDEADFIASLRQQIEQTLPEYMMPAAFVCLTQLPKTPSGKVDKAALPLPTSINIQTKYVPAETDIEVKLTEIWAQLLGLESGSIGVNTSFFDLGGNSLLAVKLATQIRVEFEQELAIRVIFDSATVRELAAVIDGEQARLAATKQLEQSDNVFEMEI